MAVSRQGRRRDRGPTPEMCTIRAPKARQASRRGHEGITMPRPAHGLGIARSPGGGRAAEGRNPLKGPAPSGRAAAREPTGEGAATDPPQAAGGRAFSAMHDGETAFAPAN